MEIDNHSLHLHASWKSAIPSRIEPPNHQSHDARAVTMAVLTRATYHMVAQPGRTQTLPDSWSQLVRIWFLAESRTKLHGSCLRKQEAAPWFFGFPRIVGINASLSILSQCHPGFFFSCFFKIMQKNANPDCCPTAGRPSKRRLVLPSFGGFPLP